MRRRGADCPVVVMKRGNARGAKGAGHRHWIGSTGNGRNPIINGRRQPSLGGTSRMMREYHVRICEGLGVKFPGSTRQTRLRRPPSRRAYPRPVLLRKRTHFGPVGSGQPWVESRCDAVAVGRTYLFPPLSSGGALVVRPWLRFHIPLIEPDVQISRIRLSDKTSRLHPRHVTSLRGQAYEPEVPVQVREWISPAPASPDLVLEAQPPAQPHSGVVIDRPIRLGDGESAALSFRCTLSRAIPVSRGDVDNRGSHSPIRSVLCRASRPFLTRRAVRGLTHACDRNSTRCRLLAS